MITKINNIWSKATEEDRGVVWNRLAYDYEYWKVIQGKKRRRTARYSFMQKNGLFLTGFLPLFNVENGEGFFFDKWKITNIKSLGGEVLRDYQIEALDKCLHHKRGVVKSATGTGKTLIQASLMASSNWRCLLIAHRMDILTQLKKRMENYLNEKVGFIGSGIWDTDARIVVASIQTLYSKQDLIGKENFDVVLVDECHHVSADSYYEVLTLIDAEVRIGFSATPKEEEIDYVDWLKVAGLLGTIIHKTAKEEAEKHLAEPIVYFMDYKYVNPALEKKGWPDCYQIGIVENEVRNNLIKNIIAGFRGKGVLIIVKKIEHGNILRDLIKGSVFISGVDDKETREKGKQLLVDKEIVITTEIFLEGVDIPSLDVMINAEGGLSKTKIIQKAGRALRKSDGKKNGIIVDFEDTCNRYLYEHSLEREKTYKEMGFLN